MGYQRRVHGIFVDNVISGAKFNDQVKLSRRLQDQRFFAEKMAELTELLIQTCPSIADGCRLSRDGMGKVGAITVLEQASNMQVTQADFDELRKVARFSAILNDLDVSIEDQISLFETLDADGSGTLDLAELLDGIAKLRGEARRSDIVAMNVRVKSMQTEFKGDMAEIVMALQQLTSMTFKNLQTERPANFKLVQ